MSEAATGDPATGAPFIPLLPVDELPADLRAQWEATTRPGLRDFIRLMGHAPDHFRRYNEVYGQLRFDNQLGPRLTELVRLAVSQTTQCQVCMAGRFQGAFDDGLTETMICQIPEHVRPDLTPAEDCAVSFALKFATDHASITAADKSALAAHFSPSQIVELALLCVMCLVGRFSNIVGLLETGLDWDRPGRKVPNPAGGRSSRVRRSPRGSRFREAIWLFGYRQQLRRPLGNRARSRGPVQRPVSGSAVQTPVSGQ